MYDPKRTQVAQSLVDFGQYFSTIFARTRVAGAVPYRPALVVPEDMSTGGGRRARQSITLQPEAPGPPVVTVGWLDIAARQAMMRTWACLAAMHQQRFPGRPFDIDRAGYDLFFKQCGELLKACGLATQVEDAPPSIEMRIPGPAALPAEALREPATFGVLTLAIVATATFLLGAILGSVATYLRFASI